MNKQHRQIASHRVMLGALLPLLFACGSGSDVGSRSSAASPTGFVSAEGTPVSLDDLRGYYVWVDYAAEWCAACTPQTLAIKSVAARARAEVAFVTVMTSEPGGYGHPATQDTAARWAGHFSLDPRRVWAANLTSWKLPRNRLFSPAGEILFDRTGEMRADEIQAVLDRHIR